MRKLLHQSLLLLCAAGLLFADEKPAFEWEPLDIRISLFTQNLVMLDSEREEYATNLAGYASNQIAESGASLAAVSRARRILALAMHLSPRNKRAVITHFQLSRGIVPETVVTDYSPQVLARLLLTRGQLLQQQTDPESTTLGNYFVQLAAEIDPRNEDAVYQSELLRIDNKSVDWETLTRPSRPENE